MKLVSSHSSPTVANPHSDPKLRATDVGINHIVSNELGQVALFRVAKVENYNRFQLVIVNKDVSVSNVIVEYLDENIFRGKSSLTNSLYPERPSEFFSDPVKLPENYTTVRLSFQIDGRSITNDLQI